jgi:amyloid beta precursor protein binding protein 1
MKAQSNIYIQLQNIYKAKARQDSAEILKTVRSHPSGKEISTTEVDLFCKNAAFIKFIHDTNSKSSILEVASEYSFQDPVTYANRFSRQGIRE